MSRALSSNPCSAGTLLPRPLSAVVHFFATFWQALTHDAVRPYRPELHYMRGPGPAWRAKHGETDAADTSRHAATHFV